MSSSEGKINGRGYLACDVFVGLLWTDTPREIRDKISPATVTSLIKFTSKPTAVHSILLF